MHFIVKRVCSECAHLCEEATASFTSARVMNDGVQGNQIQRLAEELVRGCDKFVSALAYLLCLALPGSCLARFVWVPIYIF